MREKNKIFVLTKATVGYPAGQAWPCSSLDRTTVSRGALLTLASPRHSFDASTAAPVAMLVWCESPRLRVGVRVSMTDVTELTYTQAGLLAAHSGFCPLTSFRKDRC